MIPTIEDIVEKISNGDVSKQQAIEWLKAHVAEMEFDMRDHFAAQAIAGCRTHEYPIEARKAYQLANEMMAARGRMRAGKL